MDRLSDVLSLLEYSFDSKEKRHIAGGILISMSLLFGGLAFTIITIRTEEDEDNG